MNLNKNKLLIAGSAFALSALTTSLYAGGFQLFEQSAAGLGEYHAGGAAKADDASTEFYNPAGMVRLKHTQLSTGLTGIRLSTHFQGTAGFDPDPANQANASGWGSTTNYIPNLHLVAPFELKGHKAAFGFGVTTPFGLSTEYANSTANNVIGLAGTNTTIITANISPSFAIALNKHLSLGAGIDFLYGKADYNGDDGIANPATPYTNHLEGAGWGFNLGALWQMSSSTRIGFAYRSKITVKAHGPATESDVLGPVGAPTLTSTATATLPLPASFTLSGYHDMNQRWAIMGTAMYTQWGAFKTLNINGMPEGGLNPTNISVSFDYKNSWFGAIGTKYQVTSRDAVLLGFGLDQTPTRDGHRDIRLPDGNRWAASIGWEHKVDCRWSMNIAYAYVDMGAAKIDNSKGNASSDKSATFPYVHGRSFGHANVAGIQLSYKFA